MPDRHEKSLWDTWWPRVVSVTMLAIFVYQGVFQQVDRLWLLLITGSIVTGVPIGLALQAYLNRRNGV